MTQHQRFGNKKIATACGPFAKIVRTFCLHTVCRPCAIWKLYIQLIFQLVFPEAESRKSLRQNCISCKLAFCLTKYLLYTLSLLFLIGSMNIKNRMADNTVKAREVPFHIKPRTKNRYSQDGYPPQPKITLKYPSSPSFYTEISKTHCGTTDNVTFPVLLEIAFFCFIFLFLI